MPRGHSIAAAACVLAFALVTPANGDDRADPTRPDNLAKAPARAPVQYRLSAVFVSADKRVAVINGELVREGDRVGRATVHTIEDGRVTLAIGDRTHVARLEAGRVEP